MRILLLLLFCSIQFVTAAGPALTARQVADKMLLAGDRLKTARYTLKKEERDGNTISKSEMLVKLNTNPFRTYLYLINPDPGTEVLWEGRPGQTDALVHPNKFPYVNLNLDHQGSLLRKGQHHTVLETGFAYLLSILKHGAVQDPEYFYSTLSLAADVNWNGRNFYQLTIDNRNYGYITYVMKPGEDIASIAKKLFLSEHMILSLNPKLGGYQEEKPGFKLQIPNSYARRIILYVDKLTFLPLVQIIYDDKGLYEKYALESFIYNPPLKPEEFTENWDAYGF